MFISRHYFVSRIKNIREVEFARDINHRCFNFLLELLKRISLIGSYLLPGFRSLVTLEKIVFLKTVIAKLITNLFKEEKVANCYFMP